MEKLRAQRAHNLVLVADDDLFVRQLVRRAYTGLAEVVEVTDGDKVLETYRETAPNMVLLDIHLPRQAGLELIDPLRNLDTQAHIVMVSADAVRHNILSCQTLGAHGFIAKPFSLQILLRDFYRCPTLKLHDTCAYPPGTATA